jgi:hypothetical protein
VRVPQRIEDDGGAIVSRTYRNTPDPDHVHHAPTPTYLQDAESNRGRAWGWYNFAGVGERQPTANARAADVLVFMYREVQS